ncbi:Similar to hypothetical protein MYCGRDRAFT_77304 [Mycosphaerella graminicola IPO323]; acc. no. EGP83166 [Pyronema omphalodes CBS 100304]|uniref:Uncharacterized protein n=1 Tax=Pyronema omphalodes (strain CBS 100304) TaxID=1076935 RepID=U4LJB9_PYROM|nr:Similar to hypothetical protein MYCGRDRAFT_77304 [Mycosphaerella graminicola IPO323]; acc. no. EGP83166 [Pyronema omphalodes CBS 100304]
MLGPTLVEKQADAIAARACRDTPDVKAGRTLVCLYIIRNPNVKVQVDSLGREDFFWAVGKGPNPKEVAAKKAVNNAVHDEVEAFLQDNAGPDAPRMENVQLQGLFANANVKTMEKGVGRGLQLLKKLEASLEGDKDLADADAFKQQIQNIRKQAEQKRTVIGVVGNTGAGKSSVINALLDEGRFCIVDLPGVHDANAARAAVADGYIQNCTGLWIVAPITRAVDDKSTHKLMGEEFRRQLMDGGFSSISFICSKADDISVSEAVLSLHLDGEFGPQMEEVEKWEAEIEEKKEKLDGLEETRDDMHQGLEQLDDYLTAWEDAQDAVGEGKTAYAPKLKKKEDGDDKDEAPSKKRKRGPASAAKGKKKAKKGKKKEDDEMDGFIIDSDEEEEADAIEISDDEDKEDNKEKEEEEEDKGEPVTVEICEEKIDEIKVQKRELRKTKSEIIAQMNSLKAEIDELKESKKKLEDTIAVRCIDERNKYSTSAIQADFAAGLRELDLEAAEERDGDNFNPDVEIRDYDEVANSLPVFCVSSRGYQKLKGRLKEDGDSPVFSQIEQTGMPKLQTHCTKLTQKGRLATGRRFLAGVSQVCNSLNLWSSGLNVELTASGKDREMFRLNQKFTDLDRRLSKATQNTTQSLREELKEEIFARYGTIENHIYGAIKSASTAAPETAQQWGSKVN